ncbi:MAG: hypothetical protein KatS3mg055_3032 [Chloroflexus sp.]|uniref:serine/threonine protein kinase n=1 Tax=Chloroflexus sp. TaxID=1904827 RepID=UPI0021DBDEF1|nr:serine/threonine protein kinase [Chloroflexus sp.]GIV90514.1 MAG: hypothetical protein KatS3mg055_3032 [Chloroflexus sp.]
MASLPSRYREIQLIGKGLTGEVYRAEDTLTGRRVAIKVFHGNKQGVVYQYFLNEAQLLRRITEHRRHPHILEYIESNFVKEPYYLTTAYIDGPSLDKQIGGRPQPAWLVLSVVEQIGSALDYLHYGHPEMSPIVHRDVKPQNILLNGRYEAFLIDFSVASHPGFAIDDEKNLGTPGYMAPEQYQGAGAEKPESDQFALAVVALQMLTGKAPLPFHGKTSKQQIDRWKMTEYAEIRRLLGDKRRHTAEALIKALSYEPSQRYPSCEQFADALRMALKQDGEAITPPRKVTVPEPPKTPRQGLSLRPEWLLVGLIVLLSFIMAAVGWFTVNADSSLSMQSTVTTLPALAPSPTAMRNIVVPVTSVQPTTLPTLAAVPGPTLVPVPDLNGDVIMLQREPLRAGPSTDTRILLWMPKGAKAQRTGREERTSSALVWYEVIFEGQVGWCRSTNCRPQ